ncbi:tyrosine-type recombinase/integrase [Pseudomonas gingeri]|uniref:tyrosine-type recombinase/integrase n=1 Tax=Pseudomonas gingeri TaxID=117681 RepID=UPI0015A0C9E1|nr:site-specific integrase [Pseudomonas gingeri]NWA11955.1 integrase arm-type DNA-binding domain-containing protein [Pseudomonas gingeri]
MSLSQKVIEKITQPGVYQDKHGLSLKVRPTGTKSWTLRYQVNNERHDIGLGSFPETSLADARKKATEHRVLINQGIDPLGHRKEAAIAAVTLQDEALTFIERHRAGWSQKHATQWLNSLTEHVFPKIGTVPIAKIETKHIVSVLDPIWKEKEVTALRIRNRLERVIDHAKAHERFTAENPARWKGHLQNIMPNNQTEPAPMDSMDFTELPIFMRLLEGEDSRTARCLQFLILTACRTSEAMGARWDEIDMINRVWTIPEERMKRKEHRVPLSEEAIQVLRDVGTRGRSDLVFPGPRTTEMLADNALRRLVRRLGGKCTPHGFRATFRTWAEEKTQFSFELCEISLAHTVGNATSRAYVRGDQLEKRRPLMARWGKFAMDRVRPQNPIMANRSASESFSLQ